MDYITDCLIIGSGAAGLTLALGIAKKAKVPVPPTMPKVVSQVYITSKTIKTPLKPTLKTPALLVLSSVMRRSCVMLLSTLTTPFSG